MRRTLAFLFTVVVVGGLLVGVRVAEAHQCPDGKKDKRCYETPVYDDWRPNHVPLFDLPDRSEQGRGTEGEQQRRDAQRWREECADGDQERQQCAWYYGGTSVTEHPTDEEGPRPNEAHVGFAANHCFLLETQHDCDTHGESQGDTHDSHGGAVYADVCLAHNSDSRHCDDGLTDTQAGVTIVDHLTCPGCMDEYHVVRPFDLPYTTRQMESSSEAIPGIASDPVRHVCGYEQYSNC